MATLAADACATRGLEVSDASEAQNPLVLGISAGPDDYSASIPKLLGDAGIDALMVFYVEFYDGDAEAVLEAISAASAGEPKPVVASVLGSGGRLPARTGLGVPNFLFPESCAAVLARAAERREWLSRPLGEAPHYRDLDGPAARAVISSFLDREPAGGWLSLVQAEALMATHGIPVAASHHCRDVERAVAVAAEIGAPVARHPGCAADTAARLAAQRVRENRMHGSMRRREAPPASRASTRRAAAEASRRPYIFDVFSRYVVGWTVQYRETAQLAKALIEQATEQQQITPWSASGCRGRRAPSTP